MPRPLQNVYAPPAYQGMREVSPQFQISSFDYVYDITLTGNQVLADQKSIDPDADFIWEAVILAANTSTFTVRFADSRLYYLSDQAVQSAALVSNNPYPVMPPLVIPAGGRISMDLTETSGFSNTIQLIFRGAKRYRVS